MLITELVCVCLFELIILIGIRKSKFISVNTFQSNLIYSVSELFLSCVDISLGLFCFFFFLIFKVRQFALNDYQTVAKVNLELTQKLKSF